jgi:maltose alpha-D-glucosyltransferase / alpha-amylase
MATKKKQAPLEKEPLWYKRAIIYQCHVRAFLDSNSDGIGDFKGVTDKLNYLQDLGVTTLWLLPFYPSPLRDDGYDIADYYSIHPSYGTLADFREFLREAHKRGLRVVTELVINHTSDQHPWFQRSRRAKPGSKWRDFYVWNDDDKKYREARIIFKDFETSNWSWDPVANAYYWHRFYAHQPDLNFENPDVHKELFRILDFWLGMGVDGLRLDAIPYLYEEEGTNCENLSQTHAFLKKLRKHVDDNFEDRMLIAEANQWPEDAVAYFGQGQGDECHVAFHFPVMPRLFMGLRMEDRVPIVDIMEQTPAIPETSQWALFLRNHDELTLEMVTDEERDYMYRMYAHDPKARINLGIRRRLAPLVGNDRRRIELLNALLFSLPGTPIIYYGDEIGMGDNVFLGDRNGVRTPMQWSSDKNAGFSRSNPQGLYLPVIVDPEYHYESVNVEAQRSNPHSMLWWMKRLIAARKRWRAFGQGTMEFLQPENRKVLAYIRRFENETILVVANLSRFVQPVELDLSAFDRTSPMEIFGRTPFPPISEEPYFLTLGPHSFYWFSLEPISSPEETNRFEAVTAAKPIPVRDKWENVLHDSKARGRLETTLEDYIAQRRWFGSKTKDIKSVSITDSVAVPLRGEMTYIAILKVEYVQDDPETYLLPLAFTTDENDVLGELPYLAIASVEVTNKQRLGILYDAVGNPHFCAALLSAVAKKRRLPGANSELVANGTSALRRIHQQQETLTPAVGKAEQSNTAIIYGDRLIMKLFRRIEEGVNPDLEIMRFLAERRFEHVPALAGTLELQTKRDRSTSLGIVSEFVPNSRDCWEYALESLNRFFERIQSLQVESPLVPEVTENLLASLKTELPDQASDLLGTYVESTRLLGQRTAQLHLALASDQENKDFAPEPFTPFYQRSLYQSMRNLSVQTLQLLRRRLKTLPPEVASEAESVLNLNDEILRRFRTVADRPIRSMRIRCHGDYHLGQVLYTGKDFVIIDFEGEPARSLSERRIKRPPLRDVGGMLRSFHYAAYSGLYRYIEMGNAPQDRTGPLEPWAEFWYQWVSTAFLRAYIEQIRGSDLVPESEDEFGTLLYASLLEKALYELRYELNNRPDWVKIPLQGILQLLRKH